MANMSIDEIIIKVTEICKSLEVEHLTLFGSFATGTDTERSDVDFVVYNCRDKCKLLDEVDEIDTLRKIDIFFYDEIKNEYLLEDIEKYGRQIY